MIKQLQKVKQKVFFVLLLTSFLLLSNNKGYSQTNSGLAISWDKEVGCQTYDYDDKRKVYIEDIGDSECIRMCEQSVVHYTLTNLPAGAITTWSAGGGVVSNANNASCTVSWGAAGTGSISFTIVAGSTIISKSLCIEKIIIPTALFEIAPLGQYSPDNNIYLCRDQAINFINLSSANNGTSLVSYSWVIENASTGTVITSSAFQPSIVFTEDGEYKAVLTVTNECNCTSEYVLKFIVKGRGFEISCPTVICEGQSEIYSLPFDGMEICNENFNWSVVGGHVLSEGGGNIEVLWDAVDEHGFGYVTFNPSECNLECLEPTTIKIPVIQTNGTIDGPTEICIGEQGRYKLPQWPTTDIQWEILGNVGNNLAQIVLTDQRNEIVITPYTTGYITLRATYFNTLLHCGGEAEFVIFVSKPLVITGEDFVCQHNSSVYTTTDGVPAQWTLTTVGGVPVQTISNSINFTYSFLQNGNYILTASHPSYCAGEQKLITVLETPEAPEGIDGENIICPNTPYTYSVENPDPLATYVWSITNGTFLGTNIGEQVSVTFSGTIPGSIQVRNEIYVPVVCYSAPVVLPITIQEINTEIVGALTSVCANSVSTFQLNNLGLSTLYTDYDNIVWSIYDPSLGSVSVGQNTNQISVNWNHTTTTTVVDLIATITKCTLIETVSIPVTILGIPEISISGDTTICSGQNASFLIDAIGYTFDPVTEVIWNFGQGDVLGSLDQNYTFSNTGTTNLLMPVSAYIVNPNGCTGTTNIANFNILVLPSPVATASLSSLNGNVFCSKYDINATFTAATGAAATIQWYLNSATNPIPASNGGNNTTLPIGMSNNLGFGTYFFIATYANGCTYTSNYQYIIQQCGPPLICELNPEPNVVNNSNNQCGLITMTGTANNPSPVTENFTVIGPIEHPSVPQGFTFAATPGIYHTFYNTFYMCEGELSKLQTYKKITVPYVANLSYSSACGNDNTFDVTLFDQTSYYAAATGLTHSFEYTYNGGAWQPTSATLTNIPAGNYQFKIKVNGFVDGVAQPQCEKIITASLQPIPDFSIVLLSSLDCHDSAVKFGLSGFGINTITEFYWDFDDNGAQNTMSEPTRVFTSSGVHHIQVTVKNASGCERTFPLDIIVPEPCFGGDITTSNATVCMGDVVTMHYVPSSTLSECTATEYQWMNGNTVVATTTVPTWSTSVNGAYWVRVLNVDECKYNTPSRVSPMFITPPSIKVVGATTLCAGDDFSLQAITSATALTWTLDTVEQTAWNNQLTPVFSGLSVGDHTLIVTATAQGCSQTATVVLSVVEPPQNVTITPVFISCTPYVVELTATANGSPTFNWSNGATGATITVTEGGPYKVTATIGGCSTSTQMDVPKNPENYIWIFPTGCYDDCSTEMNYLIGPNLPLTEWSWNMDSQSDVSGVDSFADSYTLIKDASYTLTINTGTCSLESAPLQYATSRCDECRIEGVDIKEINQNDTPYCSYTYTLVIYSGMTMPYQVTLSDETNQVVLLPSTFTLQPGGQNVIQVTVIPQSPFTGGVLTWTLQGTVPSEGGYELCISEFAVDVAGCDSTGKMASEDKGVVNANPTSFSLYPNPAATQVTLSYPLELDGATLEIYDLTGRNIAKKALSSADKEVTLAIDSYPAGMYMLVVKRADTILWQNKLIIK